MSDVNDLHHKAMDLAELALIERLKGNSGEASMLFQKALGFELAAINELDSEVEPTFSVLHRSAGTMALHCGEIRLAEQIAAKALSREPPDEIAEELRDVLEQANFQRHLGLKGIDLAEDELQMSLSGQAVGFGLVACDELFRRIEKVSTFMQRIVERRRRKPFRERGRASREIREGFQLLMSAPRPASFAATLKVGRLIDQNYPSSEITEAIDEFIGVIDLANSENVVELRERIPELPYLRNFLGLAKRIAPDGNRVRQVGFTLVRQGVERRISVTRPASEFPLSPVEEYLGVAREIYTVSDRAVLPQAVEAIELTGILRYANAARGHDNRIRIVDDNGERHTVEVPAGLINDIVRQMWNLRVTVMGSRIGQVIELRDIWPAPME
jgi:hypothetical protein